MLMTSLLQQVQLYGDHSSAAVLSLCGKIYLRVWKLRGWLHGAEPGSHPMSGNSQLQKGVGNLLDITAGMMSVSVCVPCSALQKSARLHVGI